MVTPDQFRAMRDRSMYGLVAADVTSAWSMNPGLAPGANPVQDSSVTTDILFADTVLQLGFTKKR